MRIYHLWLMLLAILSFLVVSACNSRMPQNSVSSQSPSFSSECRNVQHALGEICVPMNPQRVITLDNSPLDAALALGVTPVGSTEFRKFKTYPNGQYSEIMEVGANFQPNFETILSLNPDLLLGCQGIHQSIYKQLAQIAPTVIAGNCDTDWKDDLKIYAEALSKTGEAEALLADYHSRIAEFQQQMNIGAASLENRLNETEVSLAESTPEFVRIYLDGFTSLVIEETGLPRPPSQRRNPVIKENWAKVISLETLHLVDADIIFLISWENPSDPGKIPLEALQNNPLWSQLNAVKQGRVYIVNYGTWAVQRSIGGANRILDDLFKYLIDEWEE